MENRDDHKQTKTDHKEETKMSIQVVEPATDHTKNSQNKSLLLLAILNSLVLECTTFKFLLVPLFENEEDLHRTSSS